MNTYPKMFCSNIEKYYKNNISDICSYSDWWMR